MPVTLQVASTRTRAKLLPTLGHRSGERAGEAKGGEPTLAGPGLIIQPREERLSTGSCGGSARPQAISTRTASVFLLTTPGEGATAGGSRAWPAQGDV